ncbi:MAG: FliM/FliN family flagellar motor switch protein [Erythrobacter sp.]
MAERALAQHCPELTERGPRPEEQAENLAIWRRDAIRNLSGELAPLFMGEKLNITLGEPEQLNGEAIFEKIGDIAVNCLMRCGPGREKILLSLDPITMLALTDRSFGGDGDLPAEAADELPRSAIILVERLASVIAQALARATNGGEPVANAGIIMRSENATRLKAFEIDSECVTLPLEFGSGEKEPWKLMLAMSQDQWAALVPSQSAGQNARAASRGPADPSARPFAEIPLSLEAVLSEFEMSLDRLETLAPGDEIPITTPREVPLRLDARAIAHGAIGTLDERIAIRLTRLSQEGPFA